MRLIFVKAMINLSLLLIGPITAVHAVPNQQPCNSRRSRSSLSCLLHRMLGEANDYWGGLRSREKWDKNLDNRATQGTAYTSSKGPDPDDDPGEPFTAYSTEPSSVSMPAGTYYDDDGKQVMALDADIGVWGGAWAAQRFNHKSRLKYRPKFNRLNPQRSDTGNTTISHFTLEASSQRGVQALAGTYEGARAVAGSSSSFNLAKKGSLGGSVYSINNDAYGPTPGDHVVVKDGERRSVAFTNNAPNSAANSDNGFGVAAIAEGWEVAAASRAGRDAKPPQASLGHRDKGKNGLLDGHGKRRQHRKLQLQHRKMLRTGA